jgi:hypothetical protein
MVVHNRWYQEGEICEWNRNLDNMKIRVRICTIKNPGDSQGMPEFETRPEKGQWKRRISSQKHESLQIESFEWVGKGSDSNTGLNVAHRTCFQHG